MDNVKFLLFLPALYYLWFFFTHDASGAALLAVIIIVSAMIPLLLANREKPHTLWFKVHRYGYGWSPSSWQGWVLLLVMIGLAVFVGVLVDMHSHSVSDTLITAFPFWFLILCVFFAIVHSHGESQKVKVKGQK